MAKKWSTEGSMALQEKRCRVITIEAAESPKISNYGWQPTPALAPLLMISLTPLRLRVGTTSA